MISVTIHNDFDDKFKINPSPQEKLNKNLSMVVIGSNKAIQKLPL